ELEHAEQNGARGICIHEESRGRAPAQRVVNEARDGGPVRGARKPVMQAPVLQGGGRGLPRGFDRLEYLDGRGEACPRIHGSASRMRTINIAHMTASTIAPARNTVPRRGTLLSVT